VRPYDVAVRPGPSRDSVVPSAPLLVAFPPCLPFFLPHPAPTEIYTLSLHDALPILSPLVSTNKSSPAPRRAAWATRSAACCASCPVAVTRRSRSPRRARVLLAASTVPLPTASLK